MISSIGQSGQMNMNVHVNMNEYECGAECENAI